MLTRPHLRLPQLGCRQQTCKGTGRAPTAPATTKPKGVNPPRRRRLCIRTGLGIFSPLSFPRSPSHTSSPPAGCPGGAPRPPSAPSPRGWAAASQGSGGDAGPLPRQPPPGSAPLRGGPRGRPASARRGGDRSPAVTHSVTPVCARQDRSPLLASGERLRAAGHRARGLGAIQAAVTAGRPLRLRTVTPRRGLPLHAPRAE